MGRVNNSFLKTESTLRRDPTVRSEDLNGEIQGESGESQAAEPTADSEAQHQRDSGKIASH